MLLIDNLFTNAYGDRLNFDYTRYLFTVIGRYIHLYSIYIISCGARYASATTFSCTGGREQVPFSMAIGNGELMHECFPKHSRMGTARTK